MQGDESRKDPYLMMIMDFESNFIYFFCACTFVNYNYHIWIMSTALNHQPSPEEAVAPAPGEGNQMAGEGDAPQGQPDLGRYLGTI